MEAVTGQFVLQLMVQPYLGRVGADGLLHMLRQQLLSAYPVGRRYNNPFVGPVQIHVIDIGNQHLHGIQQGHGQADILQIILRVIQGKKLGQGRIHRILQGNRFQSN
ncbi:hypothetical protein D3C75_836080 [compost metagenome]